MNKNFKASHYIQIYSYKVDLQLLFIELSILLGLPLSHIEINYGGTLSTLIISLPFVGAKRMETLKAMFENGYIDNEEVQEYSKFLNKMNIRTSDIGIRVYYYFIEETYDN